MFRCAILILISCLSLTGSAWAEAYPLLSSNFGSSLYPRKAPSRVSRRETGRTVNGIPVGSGVVKWPFKFTAQCRSESGCDGTVDHYDKSLDIQLKFLSKELENPDIVFEVLDGFLDSKGERFRALGYLHSDYKRPMPNLIDDSDLSATSTKNRVKKQRKLLGKVGQLLAYGLVTPPNWSQLECTIVKDPRFIKYDPDTKYRSHDRDLVLNIIADNHRSEIHDNPNLSLKKSKALTRCTTTVRSAYNKLLLPALESFITKYGVIPFPDISYVSFPVSLDPSEWNDVVFLFDPLSSWTLIQAGSTSQVSPEVIHHQDNRVLNAKVLAHKQFVISSEEVCSWLREQISFNPSWPNAPEPLPVARIHTAH